MDGAARNCTPVSHAAVSLNRPVAERRGPLLPWRESEVLLIHGGLRSVSFLSSRCTVKAISNQQPNIPVGEVPGVDRHCAVFGWCGGGKGLAPGLSCGKCAHSLPGGVS